MKEYKINKQFAVLGLGRFGQSIVKTLIENGYEVLACDSNPVLVHDVASYATYVVQADVTDEADIESLGIGNFDVVVIAIGNDFEAALMATMIAKEKGAKYILAKASGLRQKKILESIGADRVVLPEREMGNKVARSFISSNAIDFIHNSDQYGIAEIVPLDSWVGKSLKESNIRAEKHINILAIKRGKEMIIILDANQVIHKGDILVVVAESAVIQ